MFSFITLPIAMSCPATNTWSVWILGAWDDHRRLVLRAEVVVEDEVGAAERDDRDA